MRNKLRAAWEARAGRLGIQWHIMAWLTLFVAVLMLLLWLFQVVLLDWFYQAIKTHDIREIARAIAQDIDDDDLSQRLEGLRRQPDLYLRILDREGNSVYQSRPGPQSMIHDLDREEIASFFQQAEKNGGMALRQFRQQLPAPFQRHPDGPGRWSKPENTATLLVCAYLAESQEQGTLLILLSTALTPLDATTDTLKAQFLCIALILLLLSAAIALALSRQVGGPLVALSRGARELAAGNYDTAFSGGGYREVRQLSDTLAYAAGELSKVESLRRELIANVSHDLRTPLTMIAGYGEMMRDIPGENTPENVQIIIDETQRLTGLVNDMLDLGKLQAGAWTPDFQPLFLSALTDEVLSRYRRLVEREGYVIHFRHQGEGMVEGDPTMLSQVVYNLIANAVHHTGPDKAVSVELEETGGWVTLSVRDSGPGIPPEELPYIWDRYYRGKKPHRRGLAGTGLGLSIVRGAVEQHRGRCGAESQPGEGSRFWVSLPALPTGGG